MMCLDLYHYKKTKESCHIAVLFKLIQDCDSLQQSSTNARTPIYLNSSQLLQLNSLYIK